MYLCNNDLPLFFYLNILPIYSWLIQLFILYNEIMIKAQWLTQSSD